MWKIKPHTGSVYSTILWPLHYKGVVLTKSALPATFPMMKTPCHGLSASPVFCMGNPTNRSSVHSSQRWHVTWSFDVFFVDNWTSCWINGRVAGDAVTPISCICNDRLTNHIINTKHAVYRHDSGYGLRQWETTLYCNVVSHWLSSYSDWSLRISSNFAR